jgi:hypothetical protein
MEKRMDAMSEEISTIRTDVHGIRESVSKIEGSVLELSRKSSSGDGMFAMMIFIAAVGGTYLQIISQWAALVLVFVSGIVWKHESLNRLAATVFRRKEDADGSPAA